MIKNLCALGLLFYTGVVQAQILNGKIIDATDHAPLEGVLVTVAPANSKTLTDASGRFIFNNASEIRKIYVEALGYSSDTIELKVGSNDYLIALQPGRVQLQNVVVTANSNRIYKALTATDIAVRGVSNSQEVLQIIPGITIGQHQGGGKAEQIFIRGFDADHGTDLRLEVDGMPINMVSHAHGQGYADAHFIIPETIQSLDFNKGPFETSKGDFATAGSVNFNTRNSLSQSLVKVEGGMFNTWRALAMVNLLQPRTSGNQRSWYAASEYQYSDSYFDNSQDFNRFNFFTKANLSLSNRSDLAISASTFYSHWLASGQIPGRAVDKGIISFFGAIDPNEGGTTSRSLFNAQLTTSLAYGGLLKQQFYYSRSYFNLFSNFTFFLRDSINGDQIQQKENRNLYGYNGSYHKDFYVGNHLVSSTIGLQVRGDDINNSVLSHTRNRKDLLQSVKAGNIAQVSVAPYINQQITFNSRWSLNAGVRYDQFYFDYHNTIAGDSTLPGAGLYTSNAGIISPKATLFYKPASRAQYFFAAGRGFHSNDARGAVVADAGFTLPAATGFDLGTIVKPNSKMIVSLTAWYIFLQDELVYSGDGGIVEYSGTTRRVGLEVSGRYQPIPALYIDADVNFSRARAVKEAKGENFVPLAPSFSGSGGLTWNNAKGFQASLRSRFIAARPANETNTIVAAGYFVADASARYTMPAYEIGLFINNLFDARWKETQFSTETRLVGETVPIEEVCFTPGTPFTARLALSIFF